MKLLVNNNNNISLFSGANSTSKVRRPACSSSDVFNRFAKAFSDRALLRTASGKLFQVRGAAAVKEQSPKDVFILTIQTVKSAPGAVHMRMHVSTLAKQTKLYVVNISPGCCSCSGSAHTDTA